MKRHGNDGVDDIYLYIYIMNNVTQLWRTSVNRWSVSLFIELNEFIFYGMYFAHVGIIYSTLSSYLLNVALDLTVIAPPSNIYTWYVTNGSPTGFTDTNII